MAEAYYPGIAAGDAASVQADGTVVRAVVQPNSFSEVFERTDTTYATPLTVRTPSGLTMTKVPVGDLPIYPDVYVQSPNFSHIWKSGDLVFQRDSQDAKDKAVADALSAAQSAASNAGEAAAADLAARISAGEFKGEPGKDGTNTATTREAVAAEISDPTSPSRPAVRSIIALEAEKVETPEKFAGSETPTSSHVLAAMAAAVSSGNPVKLSARTYVGTIEIPNGITVRGEGIGKTILDGAVYIGSNVTLENLTVGRNGLNSSFQANAVGSTMRRVHFKGGNSEGNFRLTDNYAANHLFEDCVFSDNVNGGNGVKIVDKGTEVKHYENIKFSRCRFHSNQRMNFEIIQREDPGFPAVLGYRKIDLIECVFDGTPGQINVSYDSHPLNGSTTQRSSGYSTVRDCRITGGTYCLELAGAIEMEVSDNEVKGGTSFLLSVSQTGLNPNNSKFLNNRFEGASDVVFMGTGNVVVGNRVKGSARVRFSYAGSNLVASNQFETTGVTCVSVEHSAQMSFLSNVLVGGTNQVVLNIYADSIGNSWLGNSITPANTGVTFDLRDSTTIYRFGNRIGNVLDDRMEIVAATAPAGSARRGKVVVVDGGASGADVLRVCLKNADGTYSWRAVSVS